MSWSRDDFLSILKTDIAINLLQDNDIFTYTSKWSDDNKAALLHANGITEDSNPENARKMLRLVAAFGRKDIPAIKELLNENVSAGVRLDYFLPLYDSHHDGGEDVFVACVKAMLNGNEHNDVYLDKTSMIHKTGNMRDQYYDSNELRNLEQYVNNSFAIRKLLQSASNKSTVQPTRKALEYILLNSSSYRDSNDNPVITFIPGAISINESSVPDMIQSAIAHGAEINDVGFFGVPGIVWSIILGDIRSTETFIALNSELDIPDEMGNKNVIAWASAAYCAVKDNADYGNRLLSIIRKLQNESSADYYLFKNLSLKAPLDYLDQQARMRIQDYSHLRIDFNTINTNKMTGLQSQHNSEFGMVR